MKKQKYIEFHGFPNLVQLAFDQSQMALKIMLIFKIYIVFYWFQSQREREREKETSLIRIIKQLPPALPQLGIESATGYVPWLGI